jgi:hypothetical protein
LITSEAKARSDARLKIGGPVSQYAGHKGCTGLAGTEPHAQEAGLGGCSTYVGLEVHKEGIVVAVAKGGDRGR